MCCSNNKYFNNAFILLLIVSVMYFITNFDEKPLSEKAEIIPLLNQSSRISSTCIAMFNIGYGKHKNRSIPLCREMERLVKAKGKFGQQTEDYLPFTNSLVKLVDITADGKFKFINGTRLQIVKGKLPYVPCNIRDYSNEDFKKCIRVRKERKEPLWIAFFGDSKMRNMLFYFLNTTQEFMNWTIDGNHTFSEEFYFPYAYATHSRPINVESKLGARLTLIVALFGTFSKKQAPPLAADILLEWFNNIKTKRLPDILIMEFGGWYFLKNDVEYNRKHEYLMNTWKILHSVLKKLASRMTIICHVATRSRHSGIKHHMKMIKLKRIEEEKIVSDITMRAATSYMDQVMLHGTRGSNNIIFWDSTLPFNIASDLECQLLVEHNHSSVSAEEKFGQHKHLLPLMCNDILHKTKATLQDEKTILLNLACNRYLFNLEDYCCSA